MASKKHSKIEFLRLVEAKLREPPPQPQKTPKPESTASSTKPKEDHYLDGYHYLNQAPVPNLGTLAARMMAEEVERKRQLVERELERRLKDPTLVRLEEELADMMREGAPEYQISRLKKEIWKLKSKRIPEEMVPLEGNGEDSELWVILDNKLVEVPGWPPTQKATLRYLADKLLSVRDRKGIVIVHQMSKAEGNEKAFLEELENQILKGARDRPERLRV